ncbi:MAG: hypothetical protein N0C86_14800 [Candidatus Thiodiazotropha taylori]|nr:hypothetical protein [Candidatus Thiodiazotropha taylori]MCW4327261.1 hypothetical protein [Candidatus Thiodiazotropha taylori]
MNAEELEKLYESFPDRGLYKDPFDRVYVTIHRLIEYANNVLLVEADATTADEVLIVYTIQEEAKRCLYWTEEDALRFLKEASISRFPVESFNTLYTTHFRDNTIFEIIDTKEIEYIYSFRDPAYDDWCGEFFIKTRTKKYILMWDYGD